MVRELYIDEIRNFLFDMKKDVYPPLPFCIGSYKFTKVKSALEFVKELENFHFGDKFFTGMIRHTKSQNIAHQHG